MAERSGFLGGVAKVLNAGGSAAVAAFDFGSDTLGGAFDVIRKTAADLPDDIKHVVEGGLESILPGEKSKLEGKIKDLEKKVQGLYFDIGKESARFNDKGLALESETVKRLLLEVRGHMTEIDKMKRRVAEIEAERKAQEERQKMLKEKPKVAVETEALQAVREAIGDALRQGRFAGDAEKACFEKVAHCLVSDDRGIRSLAVEEMGRIRTPASVVVLVKAVAFNDAALTLDIIDALVNIGDSSAVPLFEARAKDGNPLVRRAALRGLYELSAPNSTQLLSEALKDVNADVRAAAATLIGWQGAGDAVSALIHGLEDREPKVRKAVILALSELKDKASIRPLIRMFADEKTDVRERALDAVKTVTGIDVVFDVRASGKVLTDAVEALQDWWWNKTVAGIEAPAPWEVTTKAAEAVTEIPAAEAVTETPAAEAVCEALVAEAVADAQVAEEVCEAFVAEAVADAQVAKEVCEAQGAEEVCEALVAEAMAETQVAEEICEALVAEAVAEAQIAEEVCEALAAETVAEAPTIEEAAPAQAPTVEEQAAAAAEPAIMPEEVAAEARQSRYDELKGMRKFDLLKMCNEQGIECDVTLTKADIINLLLERIA